MAAMALYAFHRVHPPFCPDRRSGWWRLPRSCTAFAVATQHYSWFSFARRRRFRHGRCPDSVSNSSCNTLTKQGANIGPAPYFQILLSLPQRSRRSARQPGRGRRGAESALTLQTPLRREPAGRLIRPGVTTHFDPRTHLSRPNCGFSCLHSVWAPELGLGSRYCSAGRLWHSSLACSPHSTPLPPSGPQPHLISRPSAESSLSETLSRNITGLVDAAGPSCHCCKACLQRSSARNAPCGAVSLLCPTAAPRHACHKTLPLWVNYHDADAAAIAVPRHCRLTPAPALIGLCLRIPTSSASARILPGPSSLIPLCWRCGGCGAAVQPYLFLAAQQPLACVPAASSCPVQQSYYQQRQGCIFCIFCNSISWQIHAYILHYSALAYFFCIFMHINAVACIQMQWRHVGSLLSFA